MTALLVAGLALWLVSRAGKSPNTDLATAVDVMAEELAVVVNTEAGPGVGLRLGGPRNSPGLLELTKTPLGPENDQPADEPEDQPEDQGPMPF